MTDLDLDVAARLIAEAREDDRRMTPSPWVVNGDYLYHHSEDDGTVELASFSGDACVDDDAAVARTRNNLAPLADQLDAALLRLQIATRRIAALEARIAAIAVPLGACPAQDTVADLAMIEAALASVVGTEAALHRATALAAASGDAARHLTDDNGALVKRVGKLEVENAHLRIDNTEADAAIERSMGAIDLLDWPAKVRAFHVAFGQLDAPNPDINQHRELRISLITEEFRELRDALDADDVVEVADALADLLYVVIGSALQWGIPIARVFAEVHRSNMSKVGGPRRPDGKILKGPNYSPPNIRFVLETYKP
jgi:NTP pyrophosphatase (non-canonical NTP hydrolase)